MSFIVFDRLVIVSVLFFLVPVSSFVQFPTAYALFDPFESTFLHTSSVEDDVINCVISMCVGTNMSDVIIGSSINETVYGLKGDDNIQGNAGDDIIYGGKGDDIISGGGGFDKLFGQDGNDIIIGDSTTSLAPSQTEDELAITNRLHDLLLGLDIDILSESRLMDGVNNTSDVFASQDINDLLLDNVQLLDGGKGDDRLLGQNGDEFFIGGPGHDYFDCNEGIDTVLDFNPQEDTININCENLN